MNLVLVWGFRSPMAQAHCAFRASLGETGTQDFSVTGATQFALSTAALPPSAEKQALPTGALGGS